MAFPSPRCAKIPLVPDQMEMTTIWLTGGPFTHKGGIWDMLIGSGTSFVPEMTPGIPGRWSPSSPSFIGGSTSRRP